MDRGADGHRAVGHGRDDQARGQAVLDQAGLGPAVLGLAVGVRQQGLDPVHHGDDIGAGLALDVQDHRRGGVGLAVARGPGQRAQLAVLGPGNDLGHAAQPDRRAVAIGHHQLLVVHRARQLVIGVDGIGPGRPVHRALGPVHIGRGDGRAQGVEAEAVARQGLGIGLDAHGRALSAADGDEAHARHLADAGGQPVVGQILHLRRGQRVRGQGQRHHRRVGRIDLGIGGRRRQVRGQQIARGIDGRLHLLFGHVQGQVEAELQGDDRRAVGADGGHPLQAGHLAQLPLQRRGDGGGHHLRRGPRIEGLHLDGGIIHLRQGRQGQELEADHPGQEDRQHQEGRGDRPLDEQRGRAEPAQRAAALPPRCRSLRRGTGRLGRRTHRCGPPPPWPPPCIAIRARISISLAFCSGRRIVDSLPKAAP